VSDDFFAKLDAKLESLKSGQQAAVTRLEDERRASSDAIKAMHPVAKDYVAKLRERGITAYFSGTNYGLTFEMRWGDGATHGLSVYPDMDSGRLQIIRNSTDHTTGRSFNSTDGATYAAKDFSPQKYESALKSVIHDYVRFADRHEGIS
jgi:hypothetical protein